MKKANLILIITAACLILLDLAAGFIPGPASPHTDVLSPERIILFSLDSCNSEYFTPDRMPGLFSWINSAGVRYKYACGCMTAETIACHTTMLTGCTPARTGIIGNGLYDWELKRDIIVVQDTAYLRKQTIFQYLNKNAPDISTAFVSGKWRLAHFLGRGAHTIFASPVTGIPLPDSYKSMLGSPPYHCEGDMEDEFVMRAVTELFFREPPDFTFVNLAELDRCGHNTGAFNFNADRHIRHLDTMLVQFLRDLEFLGIRDSTLFIITADHGMDTIETYFNPVDFLAGEGIEVLQCHIEGHSAFLYLKHAEEKDKAVQLLRKHNKMECVLPLEEMHRLRIDAGWNRTGDIFLSTRQGTLVHFPNMPLMYIGMHGGLVTRYVPLAFTGPGIRKNGFIQESIPDQEDLVPTIYHLLDVPVPDGLDGKVLYELFD